MITIDCGFKSKINSNLNSHLEMFQFKYDLIIAEPEKNNRRWNT